MRVLIDTDVILDHLLERRPFAQAAGELLELNAQGVFDGYVSGMQSSVRARWQTNLMRLSHAILLIIRMLRCQSFLRKTFSIS